MSTEMVYVDSPVERHDSFLAVVQDDGWWHIVSYKNSSDDIIAFTARAKKERCRLARFPSRGAFSDDRAYLDMNKIIETLWEPNGNVN